MTPQNLIWTNVKPTFDQDCLLITASLTKAGYEYKLWEVKWISEHEGSYFGLFDDDGDEWGDLDDLSADFYSVFTDLPATSYK